MPNSTALDKALDTWLSSCTRQGKISRNTVAVGIVILDHLRERCPLERDQILSAGGEITGSRASLPRILSKYEIPEKYLKEVTTRQAHQDGQRLLEALAYGESLATFSAKDREQAILAAIHRLRQIAFEWLGRQHLRVACDRQNSPSAWVDSILEEARNRSGGKVEQHLVGAKLEQRHPELEIANFPGHASDAVTGRAGDFSVGNTCYHVTATPSRAVIKKAASNLTGGLFPVLLVPRDQVDKARHLAEDQGIIARITIIAIEEFIAQNIIEMSGGQQDQFTATLKVIIEKYNRRLEEAETDMSLKIELQ